MKKKLKMNRRRFLKIGFASGAAMFLPWRFNLPKALAALPGGMDPTLIPKYQTPMLIPPVMPLSGTIKNIMGKNADYYEISMKQFNQQILPAGMPATPVWGYGPVTAAGKRAVMIHNAPSLTIEAKHGRPTVVKWINDLKYPNGNFRPHLLPVDPTLHWANPPQGNELIRNYGTGPHNTRPSFTSVPDPYLGPVPMITHVHGAVGVGDESDGWTEAWYLPNANNIPAGYVKESDWYTFFEGRYNTKFGGNWDPGSATFVYPNDNRASTIWYHDHALGMTRLNVYAGPAGFYLIRGGVDDSVIDSSTGLPGVLPGPAPKENDKFPSNKTYYEIPIAIQDRAFNGDGSLFYPDSRVFFDEIVSPYIGNGGPFSPIWNPEFFGNTMMVNGNTWPFQVVEQRRYRLRFLNGCQSRFLILDFNQIPNVEVWAIGNEGGFLSAPVNLTATNGNRLLMALAERADLIVDFTNVPVGNYVLGNVGPDEPFGGGVPGIDFDVSDPDSTGQIMQFNVVPAVAPDPTTLPANLVLPAITPLPAETNTRPLALIEEADEGEDANGDPVEGPVEALLGIVNGDPNTGARGWSSRLWMDPVSENVGVGVTEVWEIYNTTGDAHPMHIHELVFEVVNRQNIIVDEIAETVQVDPDPSNIPTGPESWETGWKDTVTAYPGQVTRIRAQFKTRGLFVWHCHIVEHEDNEMMRPFRIGAPWPNEP